MVYFIQGKAKDLITDLKHSNLLEKPELNRHNIELDIPRTVFLGTRQELGIHLKAWRDPSIKNAYYWQGDMSAGNISELFPAEAFKKDDELNDPDNESYIKNRRSVSFAYVDSDNTPSGFSFCYRVDAPNCWLIAVTKNTHLPVEQRDVYVLTSFDPKPYLNAKRQIELASKYVRPLPRTIIPHIKSPRVEAIANHLVTLLNQFHVHANVLMLCTQFVSEVDKFEEGETLLHLLEKNPGAIIDNGLLQKIMGVFNQLTPRQVIDCLKPESALYKLLSSLFGKKDFSPEDRERAYIALRLDRLGLFAQYDFIADDNRMLAFTKTLLNEFDVDLKPHFKTKEQIEVFRFLNQSPYRSEMARLLINGANNNPVIWKAAEFFRSMLCNYDDHYIQAVIFQLLLIHPEMDAEQTTRLIKKLTPVTFLAEVFTPFDLASYIAKHSLENQADIIVGAKSYFEKVVPKFTNAAISRKKALQPELLKTLGQRYTEKQSEGMSVLATCEDEEKIKACQILLELGLSTDTFTFVILNKSLVLAINHLDALNLKSSIKTLIVIPSFEHILDVISVLPALLQRALLIFLTYGLITPKEMTEVISQFEQQPHLPSLIISMHGAACSREQIMQICNDPVKSRALYLLMALKIPFDFSVLDTPLCHLLSLLCIEYENSLQKEEVKNYLAGVFSLLLKKQSPVLLDKPRNIELLSALIRDYQRVEQVAAYFTKNEDWLGVLKEKYQLEAMATALRQLDKNQSPTNQAVMWGITQQLVSCLSALKEPPKEGVIQPAVTAVEMCYLEDHKLSQQNEYFPIFMENPELANAVVALKKRKLPVFSLLQEENLWARVGLVNRLSKRGSQDIVYYQLAVENSDRGYDFRKIMDKVNRFPLNLQADAARLTYEAIIKRQKAQLITEGNESQLMQENAKEYGEYLATRLLLINRFRDLGLNNALIDLLLQESPKGEQFFDIALLIETRFQKIRNRLKQYAPQKLARYCEPEREYRKQLYTFVYDALSQEQRPSKEDFLHKLKGAEEPLMTIASEDRYPFLRKTLLFIANALTLIFTFSQANRSNYSKCGDFLFFARTTTSDSINRLDYELAETIGAPAA